MVNNNPCNYGDSLLYFQSSGPRDIGGSSQKTPFKN